MYWHEQLVCGALFPMTAP